MDSLNRYLLLFEKAVEKEIKLNREIKPLHANTDPENPYPFFMGYEEHKDADLAILQYLVDDDKSAKSIGCKISTNEIIKE